MYNPVVNDSIAKNFVSENLTVITVLCQLISCCGHLVMDQDFKKLTSSRGISKDYFLSFIRICPLIHKTFC